MKDKLIKHNNHKYKFLIARKFSCILKSISCIILNVISLFISSQVTEEKIYQN